MKTHQELLDAYINAAISAICNRSSDIQKHAKELRAEVESYAQKHGLKSKFDWSCYILDEDEQPPVDDDPSHHADNLEPYPEPDLCPPEA